MSVASALWATAKAFHSVVPLAELRTATMLRTWYPQDIALTRKLWGYETSLRVHRSNHHALLYLCGERFLTDERVLGKVLKPGMTVIDVGANIGYFTLFVAHAVGPSGRIYAFEPDPDNFAELSSLIEHNSLVQCTAIRSAVGASVGTIGFTMGPNGIVGGKSQVPMMTLDSFHVVPDLVKIDVEGYELEVLRGMKRMLGSAAIFLELHPSRMLINGTPAEVIDMLCEHYRVAAYLADSTAAVSLGYARRRHDHRYHLLCMPR